LVPPSSAFELESGDIQKYVERNTQVRAWFASETSWQESLGIMGYWPRIVPSLLAACMPMPAAALVLAAEAARAAHYHTRPPPDAMFMALVQIKDIGPHH
jgi:hypothetical protein